MSDAPAKPRTDDHLKSADPDKWVEVGIARISESAPFIQCSCGWSTQHKRDKIRGDKAERHVKKRHGGQAMWF